MIKRKKQKKDSFYINSIEKIRSKNNKNWMDLLRVALEHEPKKTKQIIKRIFKSDKAINSLVNKIIKN
tara:strand:- start:114 stop:317 length:204 start_codon:yes stop_codon:yes gene_type:complete